MAVLRESASPRACGATPFRWKGVIATMLPEV
jgi:hypothetical protein